MIFLIQFIHHAQFNLIKYMNYDNVSVILQISFSQNDMFIKTLYDIMHGFLVVGM